MLESEGDKATSRLKQNQGSFWLECILETNDDKLFIDKQQNDVAVWLLCCSFHQSMHKRTN